MKHLTNSSVFREPEGLLPSLTAQAICPYSEPLIQQMLQVLCNLSLT